MGTHMDRNVRSAAVAWGTAALMTAVAFTVWVRGQDPGRDAAPPRAAATPAWVQPQEHARDLAQRQGRPLLIVSLNGNLDGYC